MTSSKDSDVSHAINWGLPPSPVIATISFSGRTDREIKTLLACVSGIIEVCGPLALSPSDWQDQHLAPLLRYSLRDLGHSSELTPNSSQK